MKELILIRVKEIDGDTEFLFNKYNISSPSEYGSSDSDSEGGDDNHKDGGDKSGYDDSDSGDEVDRNRNSRDRDSDSDSSGGISNSFRSRNAPSLTLGLYFLRKGQPQTRV
ncbi:hypothetical protein Tco_0498006, partial [Tanacetum coccineum]